AVRVFICLRAEEVYICQHAVEQAREAFISRKTAVGNARVDHRNLCARAFRQSQEIRPELRLSKNDERRTQQPQVWADTECEIEREEEHVLCAKALPCQLLPGSGGGGDEYAKTTLTELLSHSGDRQHLTD